MTKDEVQRYLDDHPQGDVATWRHAMDPTDYDGCPFQRLALGPVRPPAGVTPKTPHDAVSDVPAALPDPG